MGTTTIRHHGKRDGCAPGGEGSDACPAGRQPVAVGAADMAVVALQRVRLQDETLSKQDTYTTTARGGAGGYVAGAPEEALAAARRAFAAAKQDAQVAINSLNIGIIHHVIPTAYIYIYI